MLAISDQLSTRGGPGREGAPLDHRRVRTSPPAAGRRRGRPGGLRVHARAHRGLHAPSRVCQPRQPAAGTRQLPASRDRRAARHRGQQGAAGAPAAHRERSPLALGRHGRHRGGWLGALVAGQLPAPRWCRAGLRRAVHERARVALHPRAVAADRAALRPRAGAASVENRPECGPEVLRRPRHHLLDAAPRRARCRATSPLRGPRGRLRALLQALWNGLDTDLGFSHRWRRCCQPRPVATPLRRRRRSRVARRARRAASAAYPASWRPASGPALRCCAAGPQRCLESVDGYLPREDEELRLEFTWVSDGYLRALGLPLLDWARPFAWQTTAAEAHGDQSGNGGKVVARAPRRRRDRFASTTSRRWIRRVRVRHRPYPSRSSAWWKTRSGTMASPSLDYPFAYMPLGGSGGGWIDGRIALLVRTEGDAEALLPVLRAEISALEPDASLITLETMDSLLAEVLMPQRMGAYLLSMFSRPGADPGDHRHLQRGGVLGEPAPPRPGRAHRARGRVVAYRRSRGRQHPRAGRHRPGGRPSVSPS